ncbi:MAG: nucleoside triphosphate pyrophosphatase [Rothia sp. (in: high G+C Gram-positive bacteria)]|nr:nucleoside triphosphate pyrophosphatase [Rothia sp. (in: high G+C Gram-positive bacteria)]
MNTTQPRFLLASASPARKKILEDAGISFEVIVSDVDEDATLAQAHKEAAERGLGGISPAQTAQLLACAKAQAVAALPEAAGAIVLGCDSVFELDGQAYGKPGSPEKALERISAMSGRSGVLHTGHWLIDTRGEQAREASDLRSATVHFDTLSQEEITAYIATGEPLWVAGSFTIDGFGAAFIRGIEGEYHTVVGLSVHALRTMLSSFGVSISDIWKNSR